MKRLGILQEWSIAWLLLLKFTLRHWLAAKWSYLLILLIVAVGIGSLNGIRQASRAATANFGLFNEAVSGRSDFLIEASAGPLDSKQLLRLRSLSHSSDWHLFPVVEGPLKKLDSDGNVVKQLRLVGLDLLSISNLPRFIEQGFTVVNDDGHWYQWLGQQEVIWVGQKFLEMSGLGVGDAFKVSVAGKVQELTIAGALVGEEAPVPEDWSGSRHNVACTSPQQPYRPLAAVRTSRPLHAGRCGSYRPRTYRSACQGRPRSAWAGDP